MPGAWSAGACRARWRWLFVALALASIACESRKTGKPGQLCDQTVSEIWGIEDTCESGLTCALYKTEVVHTLFGTGVCVKRCRDARECPSGCDCANGLCEAPKDVVCRGHEDTCGQRLNWCGHRVQCASCAGNSQCSASVDMNKPDATCVCFPSCWTSDGGARVQRCGGAFPDGCGGVISCPPCPDEDGGVDAGEPDGG